MGAKYEDWAPCVGPFRPEDHKLPQLQLMSISFSRGFERRRYIDAGEVEERSEFVPKPYDDKLTVRLRRVDNGYETTISFKGLDAGHFMELITPIK
jgi:hypothetical protein